MFIILLVLTTATTWDYNDQSSWPSGCTSGSSSPYPLDTKLANPISSSLRLKMEFLGYTGSQTVKIVNGLVQIQSDLGYIEVGDIKGRRYFEVSHIEFHTPSEHFIDGTYFPMEMQIYCIIQDKYWQRGQPNIAIVSVIFKYGSKSFFFDSLQLDSWPSTLGSFTTTQTTNVNLREVVANTDYYYYYNGTTTSPENNCQSNVLWYIIKDVKQASRAQINKISGYFTSGNSKGLSNSYPSLYYYSSGLYYAVSLVFLLFN
jgi:carbonic anhydrase